MDTKQFLLLIDGPMGGGKSTVADLLKARMNKVLFTGMDRLKWSIAGFSRTPEENKIVAHLIESLTRTALEDGISVCVEEGFMKAEFVQPFIEIANQLKVKFLIFQLEATKKVLIERLTPRETPGEAKTPVPIEKIEKNLDTYFNNKYTQAKVIDSEKFTPDQIAEIVLKELPV